MEGSRSFLRYWLQAETVRRALKVAAVVGPLLIVINHADALLALELTPGLLAKTVLTFLVPYAVSSYSSARALSHADAEHSRRGEPAADERSGKR